MSEWNANQTQWLEYMDKGCGLEADEFTKAELEEMQELIDAGLVVKKRVYGNTQAFVKADPQDKTKDRLEDIKQKVSYGGGGEYYGDTPLKVQSDMAWLITELSQQRFQNGGQKRNFDLVRGQVERHEKHVEKLVGVLATLVTRCEIADAEGELTERIDGDLLGKAKELLK